MCGICGAVYRDRTQPIDGALLGTMASLLSHRGPDDAGMYLQGNVGLAHRRLSIIDLSPAGHQPMANEDESVWIVFNGEIYNYLEIRHDLLARGHRFNSHTDTETILHLYEDVGVDCVHQLRGMFAFAIWDANQQRLFCARDRVGKKPFVYAHTGDGLIFASEIKALLVWPTIDKTIDYEALHHYLTYQYIPSPRSIFADIRKLPPGHILIYEHDTLRIQRYWSLCYRDKLMLPSVADYGEYLQSIFEEAVRIRMRSDVPLGAFLSGGIDSSLVVAMMERLTNQPVKTFSIGFKEETYNELAYARMVAEACHTDHHEFIVEPDAVSILPQLVWHYNEPFADASAIPTYYVSKMTREHVTVALTGDGGDESFAGYERYVADKLAGYYRYVPAIIRDRFFQSLIDRLPFNTDRKSFVRRLKRFVKGISEIPERRYVRWICFFDNDMKQDLYTDSFYTLVKHLDSVDLTLGWYEKSDAEAFIDKTLFVDVMSYLPDDLLVKVDIATMAHSLEARSPFLDHKLMEFAASLPPSLKLRGIETKYLLKKTLGAMLPLPVVRRKKMGFGVPLDMWLRRDLKDMAYALLLDKRCLERGYFKVSFLRNLLDEHVSGRWDHSYRIWALLFLEVWHRMFVDGGGRIMQQPQWRDKQWDRGKRLFLL